VPVDLAGHALVLIDSGSRRRLSASAYNQRRSECDAAVQAFRDVGHAVASLRDVTPALLDEAAPALDPVLLRRARHVVTENERVLAAVSALETGDAAGLGSLLKASHASLRDDFQVSSPELDAVVETAAAVPGVLGSRLTGAGFGGSVVAVARDAAVRELADAMATAYPLRTGLEASVAIVRPADAAGLA